MSSAELLCHAQTSQLLIIDIQERLASVMPEKVLNKVLANNQVLLKAASKLNIPVIHSEQYPKGLGQTLKSILEAIPEDSTFIEKTCFSCTEADGFTQILGKEKRQQVIICGIESHICVLQTALQLHAEGYAVYVIEDAVCSRNKFNHKNAIKRLRQSGVIISNVESVLFEWLRDARHPEFKSLSLLIK